ncbi:hypothetical protein KM043_001874 [Ampulex compressa]|nr:hypothetical protein KM043_001874 [Ampulex compressa]
MALGAANSDLRVDTSYNRKASSPKIERPSGSVARRGWDRRIVHTDNSPWRTVSTSFHARGPRNAWASTMFSIVKNILEHTVSSLS